MGIMKFAELYVFVFGMLMTSMLSIDAMGIAKLQEGHIKKLEEAISKFCYSELTGSEAVLLEIIIKNHRPINLDALQEWLTDNLYRGHPLTAKSLLGKVRKLFPKYPHVE
jgi:hypothetical protein